jgi:hypothetical protein
MMGITTGYRSKTKQNDSKSEGITTGYITDFTRTSFPSLAVVLLLVIGKGTKNML